MVLDKRRFLRGADKIPSLPHLILCPGTLTAQWVHELKVFFIPKSVDILVYDSQTDGKFFWGPFGPLHRSKQDLHNRIIVASHSVCYLLSRNRMPNDSLSRHFSMTSRRHTENQNGRVPVPGIYLTRNRHLLVRSLVNRSFLSLSTKPTICGTWETNILLHYVCCSKQG